MSERRGVLGVTHLAVRARSTASFPDVPLANRIGRTEHIEVYSDDRLGEIGRSVGAAVLNRAERDHATLREWFDHGETDDQVAVVLSRLPEDARTYRVERSARTELYCDVQTTPYPEALQSSFFVAVQFADMFAIATGWEPILGGALARVLAAALYPRRIAGYTTAWLWLDGDRPDVLSGQLSPDPAATGGAVLFLNYLHHQLGYAWAAMASTPAPTLAAVARNLTGADVDPARFRSLLERHYPIGRPSSLRGDNPFPLADEPEAASAVADYVGQGGCTKA